MNFDPSQIEEISKAVNRYATGVVAKKIFKELGIWVIDDYVIGTVLATPYNDNTYNPQNNDLKGSYLLTKVADSSFKGFKWQAYNLTLGEVSKDFDTLMDVFDSDILGLSIFGPSDWYVIFGKKKSEVVTPGIREETLLKIEEG